MGEIFSDSEQEIITAQSIPIRYSSEQFHKDDSITTIKNKVLKELQFKVSYDELYLFSNIEKSQSLKSIFENISGKTEHIKRADLNQLLSNRNISLETAKFPETKNRFFLDDLYSLEEEITQAYYKISVGKQFRLLHNELFSANPYDVLPGTSLLQSSTNPLESFENQLLLNNNRGSFVQNIIYLCLAEDVLHFTNEMGLNGEHMMALYFPLLKRKNILETETLLKAQNELIRESKKRASKHVFHTYDIIDMFYDIYTHRLSDLEYLERGVEVLSFFIHPESKHILPLDIIFKNVHATQTIPFIKYNPGVRRENIYRLYCESITKYGTKIPFLPARTILKLAKETGKNKQISFSVESAKGDFYIDILNNGDIHVAGNNFKKAFSIEDLNAAIQEIVNPIISHMNDFLKRNGYELKMFSNLQSSDIEIEYIRYVYKMKITKEVDLLKYRNSLQPIFEFTDETNINTGTVVRFKRVENYNEMSEEDIFIAGLFGQNKFREDIIGTFARKYEMSIQDSAVRIAEFLSEHQQQHGRYVKTSVRISESPGFLVHFQIKPYDDIFICTMDLENSLNDVYLEYIDSLFIYLDGLLRITQHPKTTTFKINKLTQVKETTFAAEKFENVMAGIVATNIGIMISDAYEDEEEREKSAFGDLDDFETADITKDLDEIIEYEKELESELDVNLSPIDVEPEPVESPVKEPVSGFGASLSSFFMGPPESSESSEKVEPESSESSEKVEPESSEKSDSSSANSNNLMYAAEEDEDEDESKEKSGGSKVGLDKNLDGMLLKDRNNNLFLSKLKQLEPTLFLSEDDGKYSAYSTLCQSSRSRQPVILTPEEKKRIDDEDKENNTTSYRHSLEYGTDPENKNYYICPRYWCLKTNSPISEKDVKEGKCGKVLGKDEKRVKPGHYVVEFKNSIQHLKPDGTYFENTPGFLDKKLHPKGLCMPCCFKKNWDSKFQVDRRKECLNEKKTPIRPKKTVVKQESYIYDIRKYPIPPARWGFLPISVQFFLQTDNSISVNPNNTKYLRDDKSTNTLLRYGVENSSKKSFVACIADVYAYTRRMTHVPSIEEMCDILANAITIDLFLKYHNGSLASIFRPKSYDIDSLDPTLYESSQFMSRLDTTNETHMEFVYDTISAYENFLTFLRNPDTYIDHTYLWDIVCTPNPAILAKGCNLGILRIQEVDMTDDIELLCPTSVYSSVLYDLRKETVVLIKHDEFYEPIYLVQTTVNSGTVTSKVVKTYTEDGVMENIRLSLQVIRMSIQKSCMPKLSLPPTSGMPKTYRFSRAHPAEALKIILLKYNFVINGQILNYQGKTIGFWIKYETYGIYIPCFPSSQLANIPIYFMDDDQLRIPYEKTVKLLNLVYKKSKGEILCRPVFKIMEDKQVVGVLTETNQFIMFSEPVDDREDGIQTIYDENYLIVDKEMAKTKTQDPMRRETIQLITLETQFYGAFRTTVRILLNQTKNKMYKKQIADMIDSRQHPYKYKLKYVGSLIHKICDSYVDFIKYDKASIMALGEISDCFLNPKDKSFCTVKDRNILVLPETHLLSGHKNRMLYFDRMADELIRFKRIHMYMMNPTTFLNITNIEYKINANEMIMLESLLTTEYFKSLEPYQHGDTVITFETSNPVLTQKYTNKISHREQMVMASKDGAKRDLEENLGFECISRVQPMTGKRGSFWFDFFPEKSSETVLAKTVKCTYYPILFVYYEVYNEVLTVEQIKGQLIREYGNYGHEYSKILKLLRFQGKKSCIDDIVNGKNTLEEAIMSEGYYLTNLDIWLLASSYKLPIILFHQKKLKHLIDAIDHSGTFTNWLRLSDNKTPYYYFIRVPTESDQPVDDLPIYNIVKPRVQTTSPIMIRLFSDATENAMIPISSYFEKLVSKKGVKDIIRIQNGEK